MDIDLVFKIAATGIIVAVLNQLLIRSGREDQAMMTTLAGLDRKSTRLNSSHTRPSRMPSSA